MSFQFLHTIGGRMNAARNESATQLFREITPRKSMQHAIAKIFMSEHRISARDNDACTMN